jgi:hypothetical protein
MWADVGNFRGRHEADGVMLAALAAGATLEEAAREAGVSERTVRRRRKDPAFQAQLQRLHAASVEGLNAAVKDGAAKALATVLNLLDSSAESIRLAAARTLLQLALRPQEIAEIDEPDAGLHGNETAGLYDDESPGDL